MDSPNTRGMGDGGGGGGGGTLGIILVRVWDPVLRNLPHSYTWPLKKQTYSYTGSSEMLTHSYAAHWFFLPIYKHVLLVVRQILQAIPREQAALKISKWKICAYTRKSERSGALHIPIKKNRVSHILFVEKKWGYSYTWQRWKRGPFGTHIRTMPHI